MFGLSRPSMDTDQKHLYQTHRKHYCGTCKTIGKNYGHKARVFLNFDAVFLGEILSLLDRDDTQSWSKAHQAINQCWVMPKNAEQSPFALEYAAAINVLLAELKVLDNIQDSQKWRWSVLQRIFSKSFRKVNSKFKKWSIDLTHIHQLLKEQQNREIRSKVVFSSLTECLAYYGEATAKITGYLLKEAARLMNRSDLAQNLYDLGYYFGQLIYAVDAFEDVEKDLYKNEFNPVALWYNLDRTISKKQEEEVRKVILGYKNKIDQLVIQFPFQAEERTFLSVRLTTSLTQTLYPERIILKSFSERMNSRWQNAMNYANRVICQKNNWGYRFKKYAVALTMFVAPQSIERLSVESSGSVGMHWWAVLGSIFLALGLGFGIEYGREKGKKKKKGRSPCTDSCRAFSDWMPCIYAFFGMGAAFVCFAISIYLFANLFLTGAWILFGIGFIAVILAFLVLINVFSKYQTTLHRIDKHKDFVTFVAIFLAVPLIILMIFAIDLIKLGLLVHGIILLSLLLIGILGLLIGSIRLILKYQPKMAPM